jgi:hypothetical protein
VIGIFDSGVGGICAYRHLREMLPRENILYLADRKNAPYGIKSRDEILGFTKTNIKRLRSLGADGILIACCTASSLYGLLDVDEQEIATFRSKDNFRKYLEISAGHCDVIFHPRLQEFVEIPKSISFGSMDNTAFSGLYERVKDVIFSIIGGRVTREEFERLLVDF